MGTRQGGTEAKKKNEDETTTLTDTKVEEAIARVQVGDGAMTSDQPRKKTKDDHRQDINDPWVLGTRLGGTEAKKKTEDEMSTKKTEDDHRQDINDPQVLGTRPGGTEAQKKTEDEMTTKTDTKVKETIARVQVGNGAMTSGQPAKDLNARKLTKTLAEKLAKDHTKAYI